MELNLTIYERITIPQYFPEKANFSEAIIYEDLREKLKITQEDIVKYSINSKENTIEWNSTEDIGERFVFTDLELKLVRKILKGLDESAQIPTDSRFIKLYKKFI